MMEPLRVAAALPSLAAIGAYVLDAAARAGLDRGAAYRLRLAVDEIATNIVVHGRPGEHGGEDVILVRADIDGAGVTITLEDDGPAFNLLEREAPDHIDRPMDDRPIGGLGVFLALRGVDEVKYERVNGKNRNIFVARGARARVDHAP